MRTFYKIPYKKEYVSNIGFIYKKYIDSKYFIKMMPFKKDNKNKTTYYKRQQIQKKEIFILNNLFEIHRKKN